MIATSCHAWVRIVSATGAASLRPAHMRATTKATPNAGTKTREVNLVASARPRQAPRIIAWGVVGVSSQRMSRQASRRNTAARARSVVARPLCARIEGWVPNMAMARKAAAPPTGAIHSQRTIAPNTKNTRVPPRASASSRRTSPWSWRMRSPRSQERNQFVSTSSRERPSAGSRDPSRYGPRATATRARGGFSEDSV